MSNETSEDRIFREMMSNDQFSQWLGIDCKKIAPGYCELEMTVRREMLNGFGIAHGGITYALADSALAFASNSRERQAVSVETSIAHLKPVSEGTLLKAVASEVHLGHKIAHYQIDVTVAGELVASFKGTVYRSSKVWKS